MKERLSAGLCDKCKNIGVFHEGNGYNEPSITTVYCKIDKIEIVPAPDSHKEERVDYCSNFEEQLK